MWTCRLQLSHPRVWCGSLNTIYVTQSLMWVCKYHICHPRVWCGSVDHIDPRITHREGDHSWIQAINHRKRGSYVDCRLKGFLIQRGDHSLCMTDPFNLCMIPTLYDWSFECMYDPVSVWVIPWILIWSPLYMIDPLCTWMISNLYGWSFGSMGDGNNDWFDLWHEGLILPSIWYIWDI